MASWSRPPPAVSVIVPVRNCRDYIHEAIDSILDQSFADLEILVMDDGSDDFDYQSLNSYDQRIRVTRLAGGGVSRARNAGMRLARGQYLAFLDADDFWFPGKLGAQIAYFGNHPEVGVVFGGFVKWQKESNGTFPPATSLTTDCSNLVQADTERSGWLYTRLLMGLLVGMNTAIIRRTLYDRLGGFDESMRIGEDYDYWLRASRITQMHALAGPVALYRIHTSSAMNRPDPENHLAVLLQTSRARWGLAGADGTAVSQKDFRRRVAASEFAHGYQHYWDGQITTARQAFARALRGGYRPLRSAAYLLLTWFKSRFPSA